MEPEPEDEEGVPPPIISSEELRELLNQLKQGALNKRARESGVDDDAVYEALDEAEDPKAVVIDLIIEAERRTRAAAADSGATLRRTKTKEQLEAALAEKEQLDKKYQQLLAQPERKTSSSVGPNPNIKERLDNGAEWKAYKVPNTNWWETDMAEQVNRLRAAARVRSSLPDATKDEIPDLYPQLVVLGDGNTGKSTVLNRFAGFAFSAVTDGVCTRRPIRLQLRPVLAEHRNRMHTEKLLAICHMEDKEDSHTQEFTLRVKEREDDEKHLRRAVEQRASEQAVQDGTQEFFDRQYIMEELVITIEADQMIYFDLLDLPGLDNSSTMPKQMVKTYINADTLPRTFVLIFAEHKKGDTQLMHSLAFAEMKDVEQQVLERSTDGAWKHFIENRCLGVLTKVDKELESNTTKEAHQYNNDAAAKLKKSLTCAEHPAHLKKWPWTAVLNPNPEEQEQNMSFPKACQKETWFFNELFADDPETRKLCGIENFRGKVVELYENFVAHQIRKAAPKIFTKVSMYGQHMETEWAWKPQQESYEDKKLMMGQLNEMIHEMISIGSKETSLPVTLAEILMREDVVDVIKNCRARSKASTDSARESALEESKTDLIGLTSDISAKLIEQVHVASQKLKYKRFLTLGEHMVKSMVFVTNQFLKRMGEMLDAVIEEEQSRYTSVPIELRPLEVMLHSLSSCAQSELLKFAAVVEQLPALPPQYTIMDPPDFLQHAKPKIVAIEPPFGFVCDQSGIVTKIIGDHHWVSTTGLIPLGSAIIEIGGNRFSQEAMLEASCEKEKVCFAYCDPSCSLIAQDPSSTGLLYHEKHVSKQYLQERERFLCHRRAAELLVLVFDKETRKETCDDLGYGSALSVPECIQERADFETMEDGKQLLCLEQEPGAEPDWYERKYHSGRPVKDPSASDGMDEAFQIEHPGTCCTKGCTRTHDTAFNPCGHTVCCWECASMLEFCPVCSSELSHDGIREPRDLCYDHPPTEEDHNTRVAAAIELDKQAIEQTKGEFAKLFFTFTTDERYNYDQLQAAESRLHAAYQTQCALQEKDSRLDGQHYMWPMYRHMVEDRQKYIIELDKLKEDMAAQKAQFDTGMADQKEEATFNAERQRVQLQASLGEDRQQAQEQAAAATEQQKAKYGADLASMTAQLKDQKQESTNAADQQKAKYEADLASMTMQLNDQMQQASDAAKRASKERERQDARYKAAVDKQRREAASALEDGKAAAKVQGEQLMLGYAKTLERTMKTRDARVRRVNFSMADECQSPTCKMALGAGKANPFSRPYSKRSNCRGCGGAFCADCAPGGANGHTFETPNGTTAERVCKDCQEALIDSSVSGTGGVRSRMVPELRPDESRFGQDL